MDRTYYLDLAARGLRMPIGTDLALNEHADAESIRLDPVRLGQVVEEGARRYKTPLAFPLMDLTLEKTDLHDFLDSPPTGATIERLAKAASRVFPSGCAAQQGAIRYIATKTDLLPVGMAIGPFSLTTKLMTDPIAPVAMSAAGVAPEEDEGVCQLHFYLRMAELAVARSVAAQIEAGAKAIIICEPAANTVYLSPRQMRAGIDMLELFVLPAMRRINAQMRAAGVDLIFHDCGELLPDMVRAFAAELHPVILSLGSSRRLWEDAALVPKDTVLYGNLPTKSFYSDSVMPVEEVRVRTRELLDKMRATGHPYILGSECDVLHVPDAAATIRAKVAAMLEA